MSVEKIWISLDLFIPRFQVAGKIHLFFKTERSEIIWFFKAVFKAKLNCSSVGKLLTGLSALGLLSSWGTGRLMGLAKKQGEKSLGSIREFKCIFISTSYSVPFQKCKGSILKCISDPGTNVMHTCDFCSKNAIIAFFGLPLAAFVPGLQKVQSLYFKEFDFRQQIQFQCSHSHVEA